MSNEETNEPIPKCRVRFSNNGLTIFGFSTFFGFSFKSGAGATFFLPAGFTGFFFVPGCNSQAEMIGQVSIIVRVLHSTLIRYSNC